MIVKQFKLEGKIRNGSIFNSENKNSVIDTPPGRGPRDRFPDRRFHVAISTKDVPQVAVKFLDVNDFCTFNRT